MVQHTKHAKPTETVLSENRLPGHALSPAELLILDFFQLRISEVCGIAFSNPLSVKKVYTVGDAVISCFESEGIKILHAFKMDEKRFGEFKRMLVEKCAETTGIEGSLIAELWGDPSFRSKYNP